MGWKQSCMKGGWTQVKKSSYLLSRFLLLATDSSARSSLFRCYLWHSIFFSYILAPMEDIWKTNKQQLQIKTKRKQTDKSEEKIIIMPGKGAIRC